MKRCIYCDRGIKKVNKRLNIKDDQGNTLNTCCEDCHENASLYYRNKEKYSFMKYGVLVLGVLVLVTLFAGYLKAFAAYSVPLQMVSQGMLGLISLSMIFFPFMAYDSQRNKKGIKYAMNNSRVVGVITLFMIFLGMYLTFKG